MSTSVNSDEQHWKQLLAPLSVTALLTIWTALVSPHSGYGDQWAIWPAILAAPVVVVWHIVLASRYPGWRSVLLAITHLLIFVPVFMVCLMLISKDAL